MKPTILLTGATGFLGSHILKELVKLEYNIIVLKRTFSNLFRIKEYISNLKAYDIDLVQLETVFEENQIDIVIHTATQYGRKEQSLIDIVETNLMLPLKLIVLAEKYGVKKFINTDTLLDKRVSSYALSKKQFRNWLQFYSYKMVCINASLEHFYGAFDDKTKFVTFIIKSLINKIENLDLTPGEQERDFIYIDDVVDAFIKIIEWDQYQNGFYEYEIGSGTNIKIKDFIVSASKIIQNSSTKLNFGAIPYRENEVMKSHVDLTEITKLGWKASVSFEIGLKMTIEQEKGIL